MNNRLSRFATRLKELRKDMSLTQAELAKQFGVPTSTYANWELGRTEPSIKDIFRLIEFFEIEANDLFNAEYF